MNLTIRKSKLVASLCAAFALALAAVPAGATAQEQEAMSQEQQYAYTCGHLGTPCDGAEPRRSARRSCRRTRGSRSRSAQRRARSCSARRARARS